MPRENVQIGQADHLVGLLITAFLGENAIGHGKTPLQVLREEENVGQVLEKFEKGSLQPGLVGIPGP
jgi:hypothetical protein